MAREILCQFPSHKPLLDARVKIDLLFALANRIPARVRFLSIEPLLGPVDLENITDASRFPGALSLDVINGREIHHDDNGNWTRGEKVDWIITGGESGSKARTCNVDWIRFLVQQGRAAGVATFVKQLGANVGVKHNDEPYHDKKGGEMAEWPADLRVREFPTVKQPSNQGTKS